MDSVFKQLLFSITPAVRRIFHYDVTLYYLTVFFSLLLLVPRKINLRSVFYAAMILCCLGGLYLIVDTSRYLKYFPVIFFILFWQFSEKNIIQIRYAYFLFFFILVSIFSIYQNLFGFSTVDIAFLNSGMGNIAAEGNLSHSDIRPFSLFSGIPEATFFYIVSSVLFFKRKSYALFLLALSLALISGSRGMLLSFLTSLFILWFFNSRTKTQNGLIWVSLISGFLLYILIFSAAGILALVQSEFQDSRLFFWGSMKGRFFHLLEFFSSVSLANILLPVMTYHEILDNIVLTMTNDFGFFLTIFLLVWFYKQLFFETYWSRVLLSTFIVYGYFADNILSLYLLIIFSIGINLLREQTIKT